MPDVALLDIQGARPEKPNKYTSLATLKFIGGLQTQRSAFMSIDTRYNSRYLGGKPDALIAGSNVELSNRLTLTRRPGLVTYSTAVIPAPDFFFSWQQADTANFIAEVDPTGSIYPQGNLQLIVDTANSVYNYSPTYAGILFNKAPLSGQTSFNTVSSTMYMGDGMDLYKDTGANLLSYSNTFTNAIWSHLGTTSITGGQSTDPVGGANATAVVFSSSGSSATSYLLQHVSSQTLVGGQLSTSLNYTPVSGNTFTFSIWMKSSNAGDTISLEMTDSTGNVMAATQETLGTSWILYQITGVAASGATDVTVLINDPSSSIHTYYLYGAQLEVGGPATPTLITTTKPLGIYLWGITAPTTPITFTTTSQSGSTGLPWQSNHAYSATTFAITSVSASAAISPVTTGGVTYSTGATYTGTVSGLVAGNIGAYFSITGASAPNNNTVQGGGTAAPGFVLLGFTNAVGTGTLVLSNLGATAAAGQTITARQLDSIVDSNGNLEVAYIPGTSGGSQPIWNPVAGGTTSDGLQNLIVQSNQTTQPNTAGSGTVSFNANTTAGSTLLVFMLQQSGTSSGVPTMSGETFTLQKSNLQSGRNLDMYVYAAGVGGGIAGGQTAIAYTGSGNTSWVGIAEINRQTALESGPASNQSFDKVNSSFQTGSVTPANASSTQADIIVTFAFFENGQTGFQIGNIPSGYQTLVQLTPNTSNGKGQYWNMGAALTVVFSASAVNPSWTITNSNSGFNNTLGITLAFESSVGTLVWWNLGQNATTGLSPKIGYTWYYSFVNTYTGQRSNVSPLSNSTGAQTGVVFNLMGTGAAIIQSGTGAGVQNTNPLVAGTGDPQVDAIELYRNVDGGGFWYQVPASLLQHITGQTATFITGADGNIYIANPGTTTSPGTFTVVDGVPDSQLNTQIFAPVGFLNSVPPVGLTNLEFFAGRLWGSVGATLYYATGADDATLINVIENGVSAESWEPTNFIPFNSPIVRSVAVGAGLVIFTTTDVWVIVGSNLASFQPIRVLNNIGLGNYNGLCVDGSNIIFYTRDRQCLQFNVNAAASEIGFLIGDLLESQMNPLTCYLARHVKGSQDNAFYFGDGSTGWFRMNPNQYGASVSGEQTSLWSPFATIQGGAGAIASVEVNPGIKFLLVGQQGGTLSNTLAGQSTSTGTDMTENLSNQTQPVLLIYGAVQGASAAQTFSSSTINIDYQSAQLDPNTSDYMGYVSGNQPIPAGSGLYTYDAVSTKSAPYALQAYIITTSTKGAPNIVREVSSNSGGNDVTSLTQTIQATAGDLLFVNVGYFGVFGAISVTINGVAATALNVNNNNTNPKPSICSFSGVAASGINTIVISSNASTTLAATTYDINSNLPVLNRNINVFTDNGAAYTWSATIGSIMLALPGKLAEIESITTEMNVGIASPISTQCGVGVIIDEIAGTFENLTYVTNDPPQLATSVSILSNRFYLSEGTIPPIGRHMQIKLTGAALSTEDELLAITVRGALIEEQS